MEAGIQEPTHQHNDAVHCQLRNVSELLYIRDTEITVYRPTDPRAVSPSHGPHRGMPSVVQCGRQLSEMHNANGGLLASGLLYQQSIWSLHGDPSREGERAWCGVCHQWIG